jgi:beta-phosphoglucomutase-like phosphatase (HAD superfamily)
MSSSIKSRQEHVDPAQHGTAIEQVFAVVVTADDVAAVKFDPAIYHPTLTRLTAIDDTIGLGKSAILAISTATRQW